MVEPLHRQPLQGTISWIHLPEIACQKNVHFRARKVASHEVFGDGILHVAAESHYALWINGVFVAIGPARGTRTCNYLDSHDIAALLNTGRNTIALEVFCGNHVTFTSSPAQPAAFVQVGGIRTDESWQVQPGDDWRWDVPDYTMQIGAMEYRDLRKEPVGWQCCGDRGRWVPARVIEPDQPIYDKRLFLRDIKPLRTVTLRPKKVCVEATTPPLPPKLREDVQVAQYMTAEAVTRSSPGQLTERLPVGKDATVSPPADGGGVAVIVDFAREFQGWGELELTAPDGAIVDIGYDEAMEGDKLNVARHVYRFSDRYVLRQGRQTIGNLLHRRGGRFIELVFRQFDQPITVHRFVYHDQRYPIDSPSTFTCSDERLNRLWNKCLATLSACATDTFIDCPWREMSFWVNDFVVQQEFWQQLAGEQALIRRSVALALSQPDTEGLVPGVCPTTGLSKLVLFPTNLFLAMILRDVQLYGNQRAFVDAVLPEIERIFGRCQKYGDSDGLLTPPEAYWNFTDWSYYLDNRFEHFRTEGERYPLDGRNTCITNWFNVLAADSLASLFATRDTGKSKAYTRRADELAAKIFEKFWNDRTNCFDEFIDTRGPASQITHALAILSGRVPPGRRRACAEALCRPDCLEPELYMMHFVFKAMAATGQHEPIMRRIEKHWLPVSESDCPTIWEANVHQHGKEAFHNAGSLCHAFSLAPASVLQQQVLGVVPTGEGFSECMFDPHPMNLTYASGSVNTPYGPILVRWERRSASVEATLTVPEGVSLHTPQRQKLPGGEHTFSLSTSRKEFGNE